MRGRKPISVIIDTDPGVDDVLALKIAFESPLLDIRLVCAVAGNVGCDLTAANALYLTKRYGGDIPVAKGADAPSVRRTADAADVHGKSGIGNYRLPPHGYTFDSEDAAAAMAAVLAASAENITLITLGPMTNIARLVSLYPAAVNKIDAVYAMIGAVDGTGNITDYAEFNAYCDPEALDAVIKSGLKIVFAPLHLGKAVSLPTEAVLAAGSGTPFGNMMADVFSGYRDRSFGEKQVAMYDANAVEALLHPELYRFIRCTASVSTAAHPGQTFLTPDENGACYYLDVIDAASAGEQMMQDLFPEVQP